MNFGICEKFVGNFCLQPRNPGNCQPSDSIPNKYGYNPVSDTCVQFKFTGCGGNLNNFNSISECSNICCNKVSYYVYFFAVFCFKKICGLKTMLEFLLIYKY